MLKLFRGSVQADFPLGIPPRTLLFPDWELRPESGALLAAFDPFSLHLQPGTEADVAEESKALFDGDFDKARGIVGMKYHSLKRGARVPYMLRITRATHELRHYHDHFGTTAGFQRIAATLQDSQDFYALWRELRALGAIRLPLAGWAKEPGAPKALLDYMAKRQAYVTWFNIHDGLKLPMEADGPSRAVIVLSMKDIHAVLPTTSVALHDSVEDRRFERIVPVGCSVLMEGAAFLVQRNAICAVLGDVADQDLFSWMARRAPAHVDAIPYLAADLFLHETFGKNFHNQFQFALTDAALMPSTAHKRSEQHPGKRFVKLARSASSSVRLQVSNNVAAWVRGLTDQLGWKSTEHAARAAVTKNREMLRDIDARRAAAGDGFWTHVLSAFLELHLEFMARRLAEPNLFADIRAWRRNLPSLPPPPVYREGNKVLFRARGERAAAAFAAWFYAEHFQRHVLFAKTMPCPMHADGHACPGDPVTTRRWQPHERCDFSRFVAGTGLRDLKVDFLAA